MAWGGEPWGASPWGEEGQPVTAGLISNVGTTLSPSIARALTAMSLIDQSGAILVAAIEVTPREVHPTTGLRSPRFVPGGHRGRVLVRRGSRGF